MHLAATCIALVLTAVAAVSTPENAFTEHQGRETRWLLGTRSNKYAFDTAGSMWTSDGAAMRLRTVNAETKEGVMAFKQIPADTFRLDTVVIYGEMRLRNVGGNAAVMLTADDMADKFLDGRKTRDLKGTTDWTPFFTMVEIPKNAATITFGPMLEGGGEMEIRALRMDVRKARR